MNANHARNWQQTYTTQSPKEKQVTVKVRKKSWITKGEKVLYSVVGACLICAGIYTVSYSASTDKLNRELQNLENKVQSQQVTNEGLLYEMKELSRPERITKIAKENGLKIQDANVKKASAYNN
ncbi:cell division protein FtsL [Virgibacillus alimentarius]|uniref:Cell division protein FtsL n=1 Tax=Virgibacillus alimentarius TaxID=698769 RepID=A0ABS4S3P1_9BACI|nr:MULTISPECIES: cell division protein FtsL [Virgibacillus]MBP2256107.1 cell division protein FtsL [Virgibacillus alimentarius]HLR66054.1 cell division protein FtsL [Virgibacillus sp.]